MAAKLWDADDVRKMLQGEVMRAGSLRALAAKWDVSHGYIADVIRGDKAPGHALLSHLDLAAVTHYCRAATPKQNA